jgi:hypothetical protein
MERIGRTMKVSGKGKSRLIQEVAVRPQTAYRASAWIQPQDLDGHGFGRTAGDSAKVLVEQLDSAGNMLASDANSSIAKPGPAEYVAVSITTQAKAAKARMILETTLGCDVAQGFVVYDGCVFDGPPASASIAGKVLDSKGKPLPSATVSLGKESVRTGPDGTYRIAGLEDLASVTVQAEKQGHYPQTATVTLRAGENAVDVVLPPLPTNNLLVNGDFEQGFAAARSVEHGPTGARGAWKFDFSPGVACYIYPESIYDWRKPRTFRGKEAISHVTDGGGELRLSQEVTVDPNTTLTASAWVLGLDVQGNGKGFGAGANDFAGLEIQELSDRGEVVARHERVGIRKATADFQRVAKTFETGPKTAKVRLTLVSKIEAIWQQAAAIYDDCALEAETQGTGNR